MKKTKLKSGFTLVELLAVIVILAIILVIAVPKVMSVIEDSKKATLESTAKMIASSAEKQKVQNTVLGNTDTITCDSVAKINKLDYADCDIEFDGNTAKVTIEGKGKFEGLWVCEGTKTSAEATSESCTPQVQSIEVNHPLFLKGQSLTPDKFIVTTTYKDGSTRVLENGTRLGVDETKEATTISSPNWPNNYNNSMTESANYWEATYDGAEAIQITFDATSETEAVDWDWIAIYDEDGNQVYKLGGTSFAGQTYTITGDYVKVTMVSDSSEKRKGFSAVIKPANNVSAEYTVSPSVAPNTEGNFDITITVNGQNITKKITTGTVHDVDDYVASLEPFENDVVQTSATYNGRDYDAGIRYVGALADVNNKVYYNCEAIDSNSVAYGEDNYDYASSCEVWRIIGVFDTKTSTSSTAVKRVKLINSNSTFKASWDSSASGTNSGWGINQWGASGDYLGADLMQLLNGYYIGAENSTCTYCSGGSQETCANTCDTESATLASQNMKPLTSKAKNMIENAVWDTYGVKWPDEGSTTSSWASTAYLEEKGISTQNTGKNLCVEAKGSDYTYCNDSVERTTNWTGLVGLMSVSDIAYSDGWLYNPSGASLYPWSISPRAYSDGAYYVWGAYDDDARSGSADIQYGVWASVYLNSDIQIIGGDGDTVPYKLK